MWSFHHSCGEDEGGAMGARSDLGGDPRCDGVGRAHEAS